MVKNTERQKGGKGMLDSKDLEALRGLMKDVVDGSLKANNETLREEFRAEIDSVRTELKAEIASVRTELKTEIDSVRTDLNNAKAEIKRDLTRELKRAWRKDIRDSERMLLSEMERLHNISNQKFEHMQRDIDELKQCYRGIRLEHDNIALLLSAVVDIQKQIDEIKKKIA